MDDVDALIDDARTYFDAELGYQKARARFIAACLKKGIAFIVVALVLVILALIGLTIGFIFTLAPLVTPLGATLIVVGTYFIVAGMLVLWAIRAFKAIARALKEREGEMADGE